MVSFRPHRLKYEVVTEGYEDENGDYHEGESHFEGDIECRYERDGKPTEYAFDDGTTAVSHYIVYLDKDCKVFNRGDVIRLYDEKGELFTEKRVLEFSRGQLNARLWV